MIKYRVRETLTGKCILQYLKEYQASKTVEWLDVRYDQSPRALVSEFDVIDKNKSLEIDNAELHVEIEMLREQIKKLEGTK
jgi:predicted ATP-grasp superfamily ATP-dependent carboligase